MKILYVFLFVIFSYSASAHITEDFPDIIDQTKNSVVYVQTYKTTKSDETDTSRYLKRKQKEESTEIGVGSGFVIEQDNRKVIITNHHVISKAIEDKEVQLRVFDINGNMELTQIIAYDEWSDIAILELPFDMPALEWRETPIRVGQEVWTIGHPRSLVYTITKGIVSHDMRYPINGWSPSIQTDASLNHGNSGGPLMDLDGRIVGVSSSIVSESGDDAGLGFSIKADIAKAVIFELLKNGKYERPYMGLDFKHEYETNQLIILGVKEDGPSDGKLKKDDIVISVDGKQITSVYDIFDVLRKKSPSDEIEITVKRDDKVQSVSITLGVLSDTK